MAASGGHRLKRLRRQEVDFGYLAGADQDTLDAIGEELDVWAARLVQSVPLPPKTADIARNITRFAATMVLRDMAMSKELGMSSRIPVPGVLAKVAFDTLMTVYADIDDYRLPIMEQPAAKNIGSRLAEGTASLGIARIKGPDDEENDPSRFIELVAQFMGIDPEEVDAQSAATSIMGAIDDAIKTSDEAIKVANEKGKAVDDALRERDALTAKVAELEASLEAETAAKKVAQDAFDEIKKEEQALLEDAAKTRIKAEQMLKDAATLTPKDAPGTGSDALRDLVMEGLVVTPSSATAVPELAKATFGDGILFSRKAISDIKEFAGRPDELWRAISALGTHYLPAARAGRAPESRTFRDLAGFELSANEAATTKTNPRMRNERTSTIDGITVTSDRHLKGQSSFGDNCLRVYFAYMPEKEALGIIRCTGHLLTMGSRKKGM